MDKLCPSNVWTRKTNRITEVHIIGNMEACCIPETLAMESMILAAIQVLETTKLETLS